MCARQYQIASRGSTLGNWHRIRIRCWAVTGGQLLCKWTLRRWASSKAKMAENKGVFGIFNVITPTFVFNGASKIIA